jgi:beta,beta-carotene 9',10'-dioxygenase
MKKFSMTKKILVILVALLVLYSLYRMYVSTETSPYSLYADIIPHTYRVGFTNLDKEVSIENVPTTGTIPRWLSGTLLRNGPAKFTEGSSFVSNWFDGLAMIHAFSFHDGHVSYANKFLRTDDYNTVQKTGKMSYSGFAQDPCRSLFKRFTSLFIPKDTKPQAPNANVNITFYANHFVALTETPLPVQFDKQTLDTLGVMHYNDALPESNIHESAHPHYDPQRKEHISYLTLFGRKSKHILYRIKDTTTQRQEIASADIDEPSYMHSFALTDHYAVLTAIPLVVNPLDLLLQKEAFIKNFKWKPERGTKFIVIDRINDKVVGIYTGPAFFTFHHVNAFEHDNSIVMDLVAYPDSKVIGRAEFKNILAPCPSDKPSLPAAGPDVDVMESGKLTRYTLHLKTGGITSEPLLDQRIELPCINYEHYNGKEYSYVYGAAKKDQEGSFVFDTVAKLNVKNKEINLWSQTKCYPGEPVFVPAPTAQKEDDGVVLSVVLDAEKERSFLLILDASTFKELGRAELPHHIPFGIHGIYTR